MTGTARALLAAMGFAGIAGTAFAEDTTIRIGIARSTSNAAELMAIEKGYFKEYGIKLEWDDIDTSRSPSWPIGSRPRSGTI